MYFRIKDHAQSFSPNSNTRFTPHNECDAFIFRTPYLMALELKSTKASSLSFSMEKNDKQIKACQINGLNNLNAFKNIRAGFLFNFRDLGVTYYLDIINFLGFVRSTTKKSINAKDVVDWGGVLIPQEKKRVHYRYDLSVLWEDKC